MQNWNGDSGGNGVLRLYTITGSIGSEVLTPVAFVATPNPWSNEAGGNGNFCPQMGHPVKINCGGAIEVFSRNGTIWVVHAVFLPAGAPTRSAIQWWQLAPDGGVVQRGRLTMPRAFALRFPQHRREKKRRRLAVRELLRAAVR